MSYYKETSGIPFNINTGIDLTGATPVIMIEKPDGSTAFDWAIDNTPGTGGTIVHYLETADLSLEGQYSVQWKATMTDGSVVFGDIATFKVSRRVGD